MTNQVGTSGVSREELALHFDGELTGAEAHELSAQIDADPELREELAQLGIVQGLVAETLKRKAADIPAARFEQIWDEIDRQLDREVAASRPAAGSFWSRMWTAVRPARFPIAAAVAAAAVTLIVVSVTGSDNDVAGDSNKAGAVASVEGSATEQPAPKPEPETPSALPDDRIAVAPPPAIPPTESEEVDLPKPKKVEAEIHGVEFSGHTGRISKTGTVTVLYLEEEAQPKDTERSL